MADEPHEDRPTEPKAGRFGVAADEPVLEPRTHTPSDHARFTARVSPPAFIPAMQEDELPEVPPRTELDTDGKIRTQPGSAVRRLLTRALPVALLLGVSVWAWRELRGIDPSRAPKYSRSVGSTEVAEINGADKTGVEEPEAAPLGKRIHRLLTSVDLVRVVPPEAIETVRMDRAAIAPDSVTVINLWATYCKPCKEELPQFRRMFAAAEPRWGRAVRFVPVMVDDTKDPVWAFNKFAAEMPATDAFLVDTNIAGGVRRPLTEAGVIAENAGLPITLVLDCKQSVRWHKSGALDAEDFVALGAMLDALHEELDKRYCRRKKPAPRAESSAPTAVVTAAPPVEKQATPGAAAKHRCGDGVCKIREDCRSCPADCGCAQGSTCKRELRGAYFCKEALQ